MHWRAALPQILAAGSIRTQADLAHALEERTGRRLNQATISRELHALGVRKEEGVYRLPPAPELGAPVHRFQVTANGCLAVVHTDPAFGNVLGASLDEAEIPGVLGSIAGDDTVFVALADEAATAALRRFLGLGGRRSA